ncbi:MAG TPA: helix-turn-helix transcriptional regulator [Conexibacter sp.]|nr:helix-turn-helix transcriptional regulator [Conexibacter sp.]
MPPRAPRERHIFGAAVRELRRARGLTQEDVARAGKLGHKYPGQAERGEVDPRLQSMLALARGLGMEPADLFRAYADRLERR